MLVLTLLGDKEIQVGFDLAEEVPSLIAIYL